MKIDDNVETEEYMDGSFSFRLKVYDDALDDGYDYLESKCYDTYEECIKEGRKFIDNFNKKCKAKVVKDEREDEE